MLPGRDAGGVGLLPLLRRRGAQRCTALVAGEYMAGYTSMVRRDPIGVVGSIAPWNYPLMMAIWKLAPALAGGNTIVIKPSEQTPLTTLKLAKTIAEIFPEGVVNVVTGRGADDRPGPDQPSKGRHGVADRQHRDRAGRCMQAASATLKRTHLELGGKAPVIVFDDADWPPSSPASRRSATTTGPGLHRGLPHLCRQEDLRQSGRRPVERP